jgi:hypothetical protein
MTHRTHRHRIVVSLLAALALPLLAAPAAGATAAAAPPPVPPPIRCDTPYDPAGTTLVSQQTMHASAPALRWLAAVYGAAAPQRKNVLREVAVRPCALDRGSITVWTTNPKAFLRRAWRQPWIRRVDIQVVKVRFGSRAAFRAVAGVDEATMQLLSQRLDGQVVSVGDDPAHDCIRIGINADFLLVEDPDAVATEIVGQPACVVFEHPAMPA